MKEEDCLLVGKVGKAKGFKGEVFLRLTESEVVNSIPELDGFYIKIKNRLVFYPLEHAQYKNEQTLVAKFNKVNDIKFTELIKNADLFIPLELIPESEDVSFLHEYLKCSVIDKQLGNIGILTYIDKSSPQLLAYVEKDNEEKCFPMIDEFIIEFKKSEMILEVDLPEGILQIND